MNKTKELLQLVVDHINESPGPQSEMIWNPQAANGSAYIPCQWGDGAEHRSLPICMADSRFGLVFMMQVNKLVSDFLHKLHISGHAKDWKVFLEPYLEHEGFEAMQFVCRSGKFLN